MAKPAPRCDSTDRADAMHHIDNVGGAISANLNLTTISGKPQFGPQKTTLWVDAAGADSAIVLVDEDAVSFTITIAPGMVIVLNRPFKQVTDSGTGDVNAIFEWFDPQGSTDWNR